ncbi:synaptotagmin-11 [Pimephales promelas]|uniref:synaptotagmin-11 n=1 Tax=Pimephales promelas TaxID=90988 RepID=UPI00195588CC|nr:synaptotagmin-11 [Pimephales promelas]
MHVELEVHLQILLAVGLAVLCFCLVIGCIICCRHQKSDATNDKEAELPSPPLPADHVTLTLSPAPSINTQPIKQQYEELDGDVLDSPSFNSTSEDLSFSSLPRASKSRFSLRRLSSPVVSSKYAVRVRSSLPNIPKLSLARSQKRNNDVLYAETDRLNGNNNQHYGSNLPKHTPSLHFTALFSPAEGTLTVAVLGLYRGSRKLSGSSIRACLPPIFPTPTRRLQVIPFPVRSLEELQTCTLRLTASSIYFAGLRETAVGELELACAEIHWEPDSTVTFNCQLNPARRRLRKSQSSHDAVRAVGPCVSRGFLGQILILLQFQTPAHRMKVMVRKAENLPKLTRIPGTPDHYVVLNLRRDGEVISTKETKGASGANAVWNTPFLFDLPAGDASALSLELIVTQGRRYTKSCILGRVLIGQEGSDVGHQHWREMCDRPQVETAYWHELQPDAS